LKNVGAQVAVVMRHRRRIAVALSMGLVLEERRSAGGGGYASS